MAWIALTAIVLGGCVTDQDRLCAGKWERVSPPQGMFPAYADRRGYAASHVTYNFKSNREAMLADTGKILKSMAYFEWLANDLRSRRDLRTSSLLKVMKARGELRNVIKISESASTQEAMDQLYSLSKFMVFAKKNKAKHKPEVAEYNKFLAKSKGEIDRLLKQASEAKRAASGDTLQKPVVEGGKS